MTKHRLLTEFGMGSSLRREDYTQAVRRALQDALWHNSINLAELFNAPKEAMIIDVVVGVQKPERVYLENLADIFPYGQINFTLQKGGLNVPRPKGLSDGPPTVIANVAIHVSLNLKSAV